MKGNLEVTGCDPRAKVAVLVRVPCAMLPGVALLLPLLAGLLPWLGGGQRPPLPGLVGSHWPMLPRCRAGLSEVTRGVLQVLRL